jgi:hypothetical protein
MDRQTNRGKVGSFSAEKSAPELLFKNDASLFVFEGKSDSLLLGLLFLLLAVFLFVLLIFSH